MHYSKYLSKNTPWVLNLCPNQIFSSWYKVQKGYQIKINYFYMNQENMNGSFVLALTFLPNFSNKLEIPVLCSQTSNTSANDMPLISNNTK